MAGATRFTAICKIAFPLIAPSLAASALYVLPRSFREYSASIFLTGVNTEVFSVLVLDMWSAGSQSF